MSSSSQEGHTETLQNQLTDNDLTNFIKKMAHVWVWTFDINEAATMVHKQKREDTRAVLPGS